jgi:hypothetical protein
MMLSRALSALLEDSFSAVITGRASQKALMTEIELRPFVNVHAIRAGEEEPLLDRLRYPNWSSDANGVHDESK